MAAIKEFDFIKLEESDLIVDAVYKGGRSANAGDDPLHPLIGVSNQGGFRYLGNVETPRLVVLTSSFNDPDWPDNLDKETGILTYFGDNKRPGRALHETPRNGNRLLQNMYNAVHANPPRREEVAPILVFGNAGSFRDMVFLGLAVPGTQELTAMEDLVAVWKVAGGQRFQNYKASFTILKVPCVSRDWINDIKLGDPLSINCPVPYKRWVQNGIYIPLKAESSVEHRSRAEQMPEAAESQEIVRTIHEYFKDAPVLFEACAANIAQLMDRNFFSFNLTRPSRDGGRDAIGLYRIGHGASAIYVDFALEAKCYDLANSVGVRGLSRLISRLRHRQFGVIVTTSYINSQAYRELKEDGHPVVVIAAKDIVSILSLSGLNRVEDVRHWLETNFPK
ncbi:restriction endonuclease [Desulfatitalea tepidiphila]|uniref:restriction endonuclease n=1 Tax=Desulfatitalea tepidiphila TaxID=1185843 RepID=UPI000978ACFA|nr:restriction endonuclease [Desulfatitalea tepidiphila]